MTSHSQFEANRQNAQKSTGPRTENGKRRSRLNALRHRLAAESVVGALESPASYKRFQVAIVSHYAPQSPIEHELVLRLASLLWRLRRATSIETGLFEIQAGKRDYASKPLQASLNLYRLLSVREPAVQLGRFGGFGWADEITNKPASTTNLADPSAARRVAHCYTRLVNLDKAVFERVGYYEARLWRQFTETLVALDLIQRSLPIGRKRFFSKQNIKHPGFDELTGRHIY